MPKVVKRGYGDWADLKGKALEFKFNFGWGTRGTLLCTVSLTRSLIMKTRDTPVIMS